WRCFLLHPVLLHDLHPFPTRRSSDLTNTIFRQHDTRRSPFDQRGAGPGLDGSQMSAHRGVVATQALSGFSHTAKSSNSVKCPERSEEHTSELQSPDHLVCRLLLEKKK